jgi:hypothetical protein
MQASAGIQLRRSKIDIRRRKKDVRRSKFSLVHPPPRRRVVKKHTCVKFYI